MSLRASMGWRLSALGLLLVAACDDHGHGHGHGHDEGEEHGHGEAEEHGHGHGDHDEDEDERYKHAQEHPDGHDHHQEGHGHGHEPMVRVTRWSEQLELFAERPAAVVGQEVSWLVHLTTLDDFQAVTQGAVALQLGGPESLQARSESALRPGIYALSLTPNKPGVYSGQVQLQREGGGLAVDVDMEVYADAKAAAAAVPPEHEDEDQIEFLKEQQWRVAFGTAFVASGSLQPTVQVQGHVDTPPGGSALVAAPVAGRLMAASRGLPRPGQTVKKGELLASLSPTPASPEAAARAKLGVVEADARLSAAQLAVGRSERLMAAQAVSQRELEDVRRELKVAEQAVVAARRADALFDGAKQGRGSGSWRLTAPLSGTVVRVSAQPGATVSPGDHLFSIVDTSELWIRARVPEQQAARLDTSADPVYRIAGLSEWRRLRLSGHDASASLITVSPMVDPKTRTVDVIYSLSAPESALRVGGLLSVGLPTGTPFAGLVVPASAVLDDGGRHLVYVQLDGEHFEERQVQVVSRSAGQVGIAAGLTAGERIVIRGANVVRLSARASGGGEAHGHIH